jgi:hypothetical protein
MDIITMNAHPITLHLTEDDATIVLHHLQTYTWFAKRDAVKRIIREIEDAKRRAQEPMQVVGTVTGRTSSTKPTAGNVEAIDAALPHPDSICTGDDDCFGARRVHVTGDCRCLSQMNQS